MHIANSGIWKLDHKQLTFTFKVQLPYDKVRVCKTCYHLAIIDRPVERYFKLGGGGWGGWGRRELTLESRGPPRYF